MPKLKAALIGCGNIGSEGPTATGIDDVASHAAAYSACPDTELVAVCDIDSGRLDRSGDRWNVSRRYSDAHRMLSESLPDLVSICTPNETHYEMIRLVLDTPSVRGVLVEKPLVLKPADAEDITGRVAQWRGVMAVNYTRRYCPAYRDLQRRVQDGLIGRIQAVSGYYTKGLLHNGTHWLDLVRFLVGEPTAVMGFDRLKDGSEDPGLDAHLEFRSGATGYLHACDPGAFTIFEIDITGTDGRVRITDFGLSIEVYRVQDSPRFPGYRTLALAETSQNALADGILHAVNDLVRCVNQGGEPAAGVLDAVTALRLAYAVKESARTRTRLEFPSNP